MSTSLFSPHEYVLYRFEYPEFLFKFLRTFLGPSEGLEILDLGCGTGLVTESFLKFHSLPASVHLLDPDQQMLKEAREQMGSNPAIRSLVCAPAERIPFPDAHFDLVLIGSAWHWMKQEYSLKELERVLKPGGLVFIFEYQFPKCSDYSELNNWIRMKFNSEWKPNTQTPRGSLKELTECWRVHSQFSQVAFTQVIQDRTHHASQLAGVIVSQSRYQHYEQSFPASEHIRMREQLERELDAFLKGSFAKFNYSYEGYLFKKRF